MHKFILVSGIAIALATTAAPVLAKGQYTCKPKITGVGYSDASPPAAANLEARKRARKDYRDKAVAAYGSQIYSMNAKEWCRMMQGGAHKCYHKANPCVKKCLQAQSKPYQAAPHKTKHQSNSGKSKAPQQPGWNWFSALKNAGKTKR
jgi:hypothetical protein